MIQIDPAACVLAVIALIFAWRVEKRNTTACAKILFCEGRSCQSVYENRQQLFHQFKIRIQNIGIALHNPTAHLVFDDAGDLARCSTQLQRLTDIPADHDEFSKGMIAEFALNSYQLDRQWIPRLLELTDPRKQRARIVVKSQGFDAVRLSLAGRSDQMRQMWNRWAFKVNQRFWRKRISKSGAETLDTRGILPTVSTTAEKLLYFVRELRRDQSRP